MKSTAKLKYLRIAPRKVRMVSDLIRRKKVEDAQSILRFAIKKGSSPLLKLLNSAIASAKHNFNALESNLYVAKITVDEGPKLKRMRPRAKGQGYPIHKKTSHVTLVLDEITPSALGAPGKKVQEKSGVGEGDKPAFAEATAGKPKFKIEKGTQGVSKQVREKGRIFRRIAI